MLNGLNEFNLSRLLDSGVTNNIMVYAGWDMSCDDDTLVMSNFSSCVVANGSKCKCLGKTTLQVQLNSKGKLIECLMFNIS